MNLRDLEYLVALSEELHFNRAAERCFVSQPTLSGQIRKLEEYLGVQLVERGRQIRMTEAGRQVTAQARRVLAEARAVREIAGSFHDPLAGQLQLGIIPTIAPYLLPLFVPGLRKQLPGLQLFLHEHQTAVLVEKLQQGTLDVLLLALPVEGADFAEINLYQEPFLLAVPHGHAMLGELEQAQLSDLNEQVVLLLEEGHCLRGQALDVCLLGGAQEYTGFRGTSLETVRQMVAEGIGITLMPQLARGRDAAVCYVPFAEPVPVRRVGMLYRHGSHREAVLQAVAAGIRRAVAAELGERWVLDDGNAAGD